MARSKQDDSDVRVVAPGEVADKAVENVKATNADVEKAGAEAAERLKGVSKERFNVTDAILGGEEGDDEHYHNVRRAQASSFGEEYDPESDPELTPREISPAPSQNQNNLKHPEDPISNDPHTSRNYLGQIL